jgi:heme-degrading monooxygenase HmoA
VWEFTVDDARRAEFELHYAPRGTWAGLFARAPGFLGTQLLRDEAVPGRYLTVDRWRSAEDYRQFRARFGAEYAALDQRCAALTREERSLGSYTEVPT